MMRRSAAEKRDFLHLVEHAALSVKRTLAELDVPSSSFYRWYQQYQVEGAKGLEPPPSQRRRFWKRIPEPVRSLVVELALAQPDNPLRQLASQFTDQEEYFISESSVFRILKGFDLIERPPSK